MTTLDTIVPELDTPSFEAATWYQALTLPEQVAALVAAGVAHSDENFNSRRAERRIQSWRSQAPFADDSILARRLALDHIDQERLYRLLGEPPELLRDHAGAPPAWLVALLQAFDRQAATEPSLLPDELHTHQMAGFLNLVAPLIANGREQLRAGIQTLCRNKPEHPFDPQTIEELLLAGLPARLLPRLSRTLVLELHVARLQGLLRGDTPEERFEHFIERLSDHETALAILQEYPVLARQLVQCIDAWVQVSLELLQRLCSDWGAIQATFAPGSDPGILVALEGDMGDLHRGGRSVLIVTFSSGFKLVYKPKSMAVDLHFQELLAWLNQRGSHPSFRTLMVIDRGTHGWVEYVSTESCSSPAEVQRFYERQGGYLALLYALESTDFHFGNLIAAGEHPMMIDLEALFHPHIGALALAESDRLAGQALLYSVLGVGLLPYRVWANKESEGVDISGLGGAAGQLTPQAVPYWESSGTDQMQLTRKRVEMAGGRNRPTLNGTDVDILEYAEAIVAGFTTVYQVLQSYRGELLADDGPLARFANDEVRVILRATRTYAQLLNESFHPDVLRDALDRDRLFDRLWIGIEHNPELAKFIAAERADLYNGDIPMFTTTPGSRDLWNSAHGRIADLAEESGLASVQRRIQQLSDTDREKQCWFIRASLATLAMGEGSTRQSYPLLVDGQAPASRESLLQAARAVGDHLGALALRSEQEASWIGLASSAHERWSLAPLGADLYNGISGVTLFLAYLGSVTGDQHYTVLARAALATLRRQITAEGASLSLPVLSSIGAFDGLGGIIYLLSHLGAVWQDAELLAEAETLVERIPELLAQDTKFDLIGGAAGCIGGLLSLYNCTASQQVLAVAVQCGDWLLQHAQPQSCGIGWNTTGGATAPLAGFSHGAAGIAAALLELASASGQARFSTAALDAISYERALFSPGAGNWCDLRLVETNDEWSTSAWCHGAPGIGLGRLQALRHLDDLELRAEIETAIKTTQAIGSGGNHSLCHGELGNLELLLQASQTFEDAALHEQTYRIAASILEKIDTHGWRCGVPLGVETPGLMTGLAGIGYGLLRLAEPHHVPAVLVLAAPVPTLVLICQSPTES